MAIVFLLFGVASWIVFKNKNVWLLAEIQRYVDESQSGQLEIESIDLKLFKNFPHVTLELGGVNYYEHRDSLRTPGEKPILHADQLFVAVELFPMMKEELSISELSLSKAQFNIIEYKNGILNIDKALAKPATRTPPVTPKKVVTKSTPALPPSKEKMVKPDTSSKIRPKVVSKPKPKAALKVDLDLINLNETLIHWKSYANPKPSVILINELDAYLFNKEKELAVELTSSHKVQSLYVNHSLLPPGELTLNVELVFNQDNQLLTILKSKINYDIFSASIQGTYAHQKNRKLDLKMNASSNELAILSLIIQPQVIKTNPKLVERGNIYVTGRIFGELKNQPPQFDFSFGVKDLALRLPSKLGTFKNIGFEGSFSSGSLANYAEAKLDIRNLRGQLPGGFLKGQFHLHNFVDPYVNYKLDAQLKLDEYDRLFRIGFLKGLRGEISLHANFDGLIEQFAEHRTDSSRSSRLILKDLSFVVAKTNQLVSGLSGKIENRNNQVVLQHLSFHYGKNDMLLNATVDNLAHLLFKHECDVIASGNLRANEIFTRDFILDTMQTAQVQDRIRELSFDFKVGTSENKVGGPSSIPVIAFDIRNLSAKLDKLPDITMINTAGRFSQTEHGLKLDLNEFHATMPQGKLDVVGDLLIRTKTLWEFNAKVKADKFPWTYVNELAAEIRDDAEPRAKNLPVTKMELFTADLDLSAALITYPFDIDKLNVRNSRINFSMPGSQPISVEKLNLALEHLHFRHPATSGALTGMKSTKGKLELSQLNVPGLNALDIKMNITGEDDKLDIGFSSITQKTKSEKGQLVLDISQKDLNYNLQYFVRGASLEYFVQKFYKKKLMEGTINYTLNIHSTGSTWAKVKQNLSGEIEIRGDSLHLYGIDIDNVLKKYKKSQNFNLTDVGAVLIAGPVGLAVTKGSDFVSLATINFNSGQRTNIKTLLTKWKLEKGQLTTEDVAFSTSMNRIAFDGQIDIAKDSIPGITISVVDKNGCSLMDQKLYGKMGKIQTGKLNVTKTLLGSVINFANAIVGKDCKPVYTGRVKDPLHQ
jgi:AsmA protein